MKFTLGLLTGLTLYHHVTHARWVQKLLWYLFTADTRPRRRRT